MASVWYRRTGGWWARVSLLTVSLALILLLVSLMTMVLERAFASELPQTQSKHFQEESVQEGSTGSDSDEEFYRFNSQDLLDAQTNPSGSQNRIIIPHGEVPLSGSLETGHIISKGGSLYNTVLALLCIALMGAMLLLLLIRKTTDFRVIAMRTISVAFGLLTVVTWSLLDKLQIPVVLFNNVSVLITSIFILFIATATASYVFEARHTSNKSASPKRS